MYYLFEASIGYFLFKELTINSSNLKTKEVQNDLMNYEKFKTMIAFEGSLLFHGHNVAIESIESLQKGDIPKNLITFLKGRLGKVKNRKLGVQDKDLAKQIVKKLKYKVNPVTNTCWEDAYLCCCI